MTGVFVNGHYYLEDMPSIAPENALANAGAPWDAEEEALLNIILPQYGLQRTAWALRRSADGVQKKAVELGISYASRPPVADRRGGVAA